MRDSRTINFSSTSGGLLSSRVLQFLEILFVSIALILGTLWFFDSDGNYEPLVVVITLLIGSIEIYRRKIGVRKITDAPDNILTNPHSHPDDTKVTPGAINEPNKRSDISVEEIIKDVNSSAPFQKKTTAAKYNGLIVEWIGYLYEVTEYPDDKSKVSVNLLCKDLLYAFNFWFAVDPQAFPDIKHLHKTSCLKVCGEIIRVSGGGLCVTLEPIDIEVLEAKRT